jgi:hypothetical protein
MGALAMVMTREQEKEKTKEGRPLDVQGYAHR